MCGKGALILPWYMVSRIPDCTTRPNAGQLNDVNMTASLTMNAVK